MMIDLSPVLQAVLMLIGAIITAFVVPYIKSRTTAQQREQLATWVSVAVTAAEQLYTGSGRGAEKKEYVLGFLLEHGYTVDEMAIDALIEAVVYELKVVQ